MVNLPDDVLQEVFQLLCCPRYVAPDYTGLQRPIGFGPGRGADGTEVVNLFDGPRLPTAYQLAQVSRAWRRLTAEIPRIWNYQLVLDCRPLDTLYRQLRSSAQGTHSLQHPSQDYLSHPQISKYTGRLDQLLSVRHRYSQEGGRKEPLLLTVTFYGSPTTSINQHILSTLYRYSPQLTRINFIGGWVVAGTLPITTSPSSPTFGVLEELLVRNPSGTNPLPKLLCLSKDVIPGTIFPRLHTLVLSEISIPSVVPYLPWAQLTSLSIGAVGLRHTASFDSDPNEIMQVLRLTRSLRYLRIHGLMRRTMKTDSRPAGQANGSEKRPLVVLPHLIHLEIHDMDSSIITSPLFTVNWTKPRNEYHNDPGPLEPILPGLLCAPALEALDLYLPDSMSHTNWSVLGYSIPPLASILPTFLHDRVCGFSLANSSEDNNEGATETGQLSSPMLKRIKLRIAVASPPLFGIARKSSPTMLHDSKVTTSHIVHGAPSIFRLLLKLLPQPVGQNGTCTALKQLLTVAGRLPKSPVNLPLNTALPSINTEEATEGQKRRAILAMVTEFQRNGVGKAYSSDEVKLQPVTTDVVSTERFMDRFIKLATPPDSVDTSSDSAPDTWWHELENLDFDSLTDRLEWGNRYLEAAILEILTLLAWDGTSSSGEANAVCLDRWLYLLAE